MYVLTCTEKEFQVVKYLLWREKIEDNKKKGLLIKEERAGNKAGISFYLFFFLFTAYTVVLPADYNGYQREKCP